MSKADLVEIIETQKQVIQTQQAGLDWFSNSTLPIAARFAGYAIHRFVQERKPGEDGYYKGYLPAMAQISGVSTSTISRGIETLAGATEALDKYTRHEYDEDGNKKSLLYFRTHEEFKTPAAIAPTKELERHGGDHRIFCQACGSDDIIEKKRYTCRKCGTVVKDFPERLVNEPLQDAILPNPDIPVASCNGSDLPSTPPAVEPILDPQEQERQAAQLLLAIAGQGDEHIEMSDSGPAKYFTVHRPLRLDDMQRHLRGRRTKGATLQHGELTRAICFDADDAAGLDLLREAAQTLALVDWQPIIEPSPTTGDHAGGGHLWIIFNDLVDSYSAYQSALQYAPQLRQCKEYWPREGNNRVRLPGGKYVKPGFEAWCHLFDENMQNGIGTAAMLLERQTSAGLVNEYPKPEPVAAPSPQRTEQAPGGRYLEKDVGKQIIAEFNAMRDWSDIAQLAGGFSHGKFRAVWRGDRTPNVAINPRTDLAKDFARPDELAMDKYEVWCRIMAHERGMDWRDFKRHDLEERCAYRRVQQERGAS